MSVYRIGFVMEQTLGHVTHDRNLRQWTATDSSVTPRWMPVEFHRHDRWERIGNWSIRASLRARDQMREAMAESPLSAIFCHTQVCALFLGKAMCQVPTIVSLDATPLNLDTLHAAYDHHPSRFQAVETLKTVLNRRSFRRAKRLVTWSDWAKKSLVRDYGIAPDKITVIAPGIDLDQWHFDRAPHHPERLHLLFVGGDFRRKGGILLLDAMRDNLADTCELDIVTREDVNADGIPNVRVHHGINANTPEMLALYQQADAFVFPTHGDCLPIAVMEAMAAELPVVATNVGAICEEVIDHETGYLIAPGDKDAFVHAVSDLAADDDRRAEMGRAGRRRATDRFDGATNYRRIVDETKRCADAR